MNLRWSYNNVRIKEGDKWKAVFSMPEEFVKEMKDRHEEAKVVLMKL